MKKTISLLLVLIMSFSCFSLVSFAETTKTAEHLTEVPEGYIGVYTKEDLNTIRNKTSLKYILMNDIVFTDSDYEEGGLFYNSGEGWQPIASFSGTFDGNGYKIENLKCNMPNKDYVGLFGKATSAQIRNVILVNADIIGKNYVGGICGLYDSVYTIENCLTHGSIKGSAYVGGICGQAKKVSIISNTNHDDSTKADALINNCVNVATVVSEGLYAGGICGYVGLSTQNANPDINRCINTGNITASESCGGICGVLSSSGEIYNSYNTGDISAEDLVGGLVGYSGHRINNSYSVGFVSSKGYYAGGLLGRAATYGTEIINSYYSDIVAGGRNILHFEDKRMFEGWDFDTIWTMDGREDYPYPELRDVPLILPEDLNHKHEYTSEITTPATHLKEGVETFTCKCGDSYTEPVTKLVEHTYTSEVTKEATHLAEGETTYTCECGDTYTEVIAKLTAHTYDKTVTEPTCTEKGYTIYTCECGDTYTEEIAAVGHKELVIPSVEATCTDEGLSAGKICEACGEELTSQQIIPAKGHKFSSWIVISEVTCDTNGRKVRICACGAVEEDIENSFGHSDADNDNKCDSCNEALKKEVNMPAEKDNVFTFLKSFLNNLIEFFRQLLGIKK